MRKHLTIWAILSGFVAASLFAAEPMTWPTPHPGPAAGAGDQLAEVDQARDALQRLPALIGQHFDLGIGGDRDRDS